MNVVVVEWLYYSKRIIIVGWADLQSSSAFAFQLLQKRVGPWWKGGTRASFNSSCDSFRRSSSACKRRSLLLTEMMREARAIAKATAGTPSQQKMTVAMGAQRARTAKARRKNAHANEASLLLAKHAKEEPPDRGMLALGDRRIAMLVAEPFAVLPTRAILARLPERQASSKDHRALGHESAQRMSPNQNISSLGQRVHQS